MHLAMTMMRDSRPNVRRRRDGLVQILPLQPPPFSLGALRTLGFSALGGVLLIAALLAAPFWLARSVSHGGQGQARRTTHGASVTDLGGRR
jgi:hypothetical protein